MRVIVETQSRARARLRTRVRSSLVRAFRRLAGVPTRAADNDITVRQVSRVSSVVRSVVPHPLVENAQVRAMATGLIIGSIHVVFAVVNVVLALLARSVWALSVGVVIAALNVGKSYLASGALMSVAIDSSYETEESLLRCRRVGVALVLVVLVQVLDYFIPLLGAKYSGGSRWGERGCLAGTLVGLFFMPWGIVLGPFLGAFIGELLGGRETKDALRSGFGSLLGFLLGTVVKCALCGYLLWKFVEAVW